MYPLKKNSAVLEFWKRILQFNPPIIVSYFIVFYPQSLPDMGSIIKSFKSLKCYGKNIQDLRPVRCAFTVLLEDNNNDNNKNDDDHNDLVRSCWQIVFTLLLVWPLPGHLTMSRGMTSALRRCLSTSSRHATKYNEPLSGNAMPRSGGIASMFRLPVQTDTQGKK